MSLKQAVNPDPTRRDPRPALIVLIVLCFVFIVTYVGRLAERAQMNAETARLEGQIAQAKVHHTELAAQREYVNSQAFVDEKARESLGLVKRGDEMIIALPPVASPVNIDANTTVNTELPPLITPEKSSSPSQLPIWQQWVDLFVAPALR